MQLKQALHNIKTLQTLTTQWPTPAQLREQKQEPYKPGRTRTPNPETLPFNLERTLPTRTRARTRDGATLITYNVLALWWKHIKNRPYKAIADYDVNLKMLKKVAYQAHQDLPENVWLSTTARLNELTLEALTICGYGTEPTGLTCPHCHKQLVKNYTPNGLTDYMNCIACATTWTAQELADMAQAIARHNPHDMLVTVGTASKILGITAPAVSLRIKRNRIQPAQTLGKQRLYLLADLIRL